MIGYSSYNSPIGKIYVVVDKIGLKQVILFKDSFEGSNIPRNDELCKDVINQLDEYFNHKRQTFNLPLHLEGTGFQKEVWNALNTIPYGSVCSYKDIACQINRPKAVRAIGQANKANQLPIIIPCHRVIGKNGKMVGYAGDHISTKEFLLKHEGIIK